MDVRARVGNNVRHFRERVGLSQEALAHVAGLDRTYVSGIERGRRNPTVVVLERLSIALGIRMAELVADPDAGSPLRFIPACYCNKKYLKTRGGSIGNKVRFTPTLQYVKRPWTRP